MKTIEKITSEPQVKQINALVKKAFGFGCKGNWGYLDLGDNGIMPVKEKYPKFIARRIVLIPGLIDFSIIKGRFTSNNGSSLQIDDKHKNQAEKYSNLYKQLTGKNIKIEYTPKETYLY